MERESADDQESAGVTQRQRNCKISRWHGTTKPRRGGRWPVTVKSCVGQCATASGVARLRSRIKLYQKLAIFGHICWCYFAITF